MKVKLSVTTWGILLSALALLYCGVTEVSVGGIEIHPNNIHYYVLHKKTAQNYSAGEVAALKQFNQNLPQGASFYSASPRLNFLPGYPQSFDALLIIDQNTANFEGIVNSALLNQIFEINKVFHSGGFSFAAKDSTGDEKIILVLEKRKSSFEKLSAKTQQKKLTQEDSLLVRQGLLQKIQSHLIADNQYDVLRIIVNGSPLATLKSTQYNSIVSQREFSHFLAFSRP